MTDGREMGMAALAAIRFSERYYALCAPLDEDRIRVRQGDLVEAFLDAPAGFVFEGEPPMFVAGALGLRIAVSRERLDPIVRLEVAGRVMGGPYRVLARQLAPPGPGLPAFPKVPFVSPGTLRGQLQRIVALHHDVRAALAG